MEITKLEKAALLTTGAGASFLTLLWMVGAAVDSSADAVFWLRITFAAVSFAAFDLVIWALVAHGRSVSGALALAVASAVSGLIALDVARVVDWPGLHAAPAVTLAAFGLHLMWSRSPAAPAPVPTISNTQINVGVLPRTFAEFAAARAQELPHHTPAQLAQELGTGESTVRKLLERAGVVIDQPSGQED